MTCFDQRYLFGLLFYAGAECILGLRAKKNPNRPGSILELAIWIGFGVFIMAAIIGEGLKNWRKNGSKGN